MALRPRIGLLSLHWGMFDPIMPPQYRQEKEALSKQIVEILSEHGEVIYPGLVTDEASGAAAGRTFESNIDVLVVFPCMATPPSFGWSALAAIPGTPVVFWNAHLLDRIPDSFDAADLVRHSCNVGSIMLTNVLLREGQPFRLFTGRWGDGAFTQRVVRAVHAGAAAGRLRRARLGVLGDVIPGYLDVMIDRQALKRDLGIELVDIPAQELTEAFRSVTATKEKEVLAEMRTWKVDGVSEADQRNSARLAAALEHLVEEHGLHGGALNCHTAYFLKNPDIGIVACYGVSRLLQRGLPFTCTGDIPTAVAALTLKLLGAPAQYCECDMIDYKEDYMLLSNSGEGDPGIALSAQSIHVLPNEQFKKGGNCGACLLFRFRRGPGTLVGFSPRKLARGGWSFVIAGGTIIERHFPRIGAPNTGFRFKNGNTAAAFARWCSGGATHHGMVTCGDYVDELCDVAEYLGVEAWVV